MKAVSMKALIAKLLKRSQIELVSNVSYTASTAWAKRSTFTASVAGIYRIRASYANSPVVGLAVGPSTATNLYQTYILADNTQNASTHAFMWLDAGTYAVWTKCATNSGTNSVTVWRIMSAE